MKVGDIITCKQLYDNKYDLTINKEYKILDKDVIGILILDDCLYPIWINDCYISIHFRTRNQMRKLKLNSL